MRKPCWTTFRRRLNIRRPQNYARMKEKDDTPGVARGLLKATSLAGAAQAPALCGFALLGWLRQQRLDFQRSPSARPGLLFSLPELAICEAAWRSLPARPPSAFTSARRRLHQHRADGRADEADGMVNAGWCRARRPEAPPDPLFSLDFQQSTGGPTCGAPLGRRAGCAFGGKLVGPAVRRGHLAVRTTAGTGTSCRQRPPPAGVGAARRPVQPRSRLLHTPEERSIEPPIRWKTSVVSWLKFSSKGCRQEHFAALFGVRSPWAVNEDWCSR